MVTNELRLEYEGVVLRLVREVNPVTVKDMEDELNEVALI